ncbi:unnamed protein product, partial [Brassica oleracea]
GSNWSTRPYLDSVRKQIYLRDCNFAAAGSTIQKENAAPISPFGFGVQASQLPSNPKLYLPTEYFLRKWIVYV